MPRKEKEYHYIYKTTNIVNSKFYVGMHSTNDLNDGYLGSGTKLWYSISKYGKKNFKIEILEFFESREDLKNREEELISESLLKDPLCMNLVKGGGGFKSTFVGKLTDDFYKKNGRKNLTKAWTNKEFRNKVINLTKEMHKLGLLDGFKGKVHTMKSKNKMRSKALLRIGEKNSQFGTCWITNNRENKKIKKEDLEKYLNEGWIKGRKIQALVP